MCEEWCRVHSPVSTLFSCLAQAPPGVSEGIKVVFVRGPGEGCLRPPGGSALG